MPSGFNISADELGSPSAVKLVVLVQYNPSVGVGKACYIAEYIVFIGKLVACGGHDFFKAANLIISIICGAELVNQLGGQARSIVLCNAFRAVPKTYADRLVQNTKKAPRAWSVPCKTQSTRPGIHRILRCCPTVTPPRSVPAGGCLLLRQPDQKRPVKGSPFLRGDILAGEQVI